MTIKDVMEDSKTDERSIIVSIVDSESQTPHDEVYFGELSDIPSELHSRYVLEISRVIASSDLDREGINILTIV